MRKLIYIIVFLYSLGGFAKPPLSEHDLLVKAESAYDSKKYKEAIESYEALLAEGLKSWQVYYNLGNAYYRDKQLGRAIYNYELARKLNPNDEDVRINLGIASAKTVDKIDSKENFFISAVKTNVLSSFDTRGWAWLSILNIVLLSVFIFVFISSRKVVVKRLSFVLSLALLIGFFITYFLGYSALQSKYENKFGIIIARET